jgi:hypothetical protein
VAPGLRLAARHGRLTLEGPAVTPDLARALAAWLAAR